MTLYQALKDANVPIDHHESDLYVKDTPMARAIMVQYPERIQSARLFMYADGEQWIDIPGAFDPWGIPEDPPNAKNEQ